MSEFRMPSLGADMDRGTLTEWLVAPGDRLHRGDVVAVVETDKGAIEIEIFEDAVLAEFLVMPMTEVPVGTPLARLEAIGDTAPAPPEQPEPPRKSPDARAMPKQPPLPSSSPEQPRRTRLPPDAGERRKISPAARKHARELGVDVDSIQATGHGGVVTLADVEAAATGKPSLAAAAPSTQAPGRAAAVDSTQTEAMRRAISAAVSRSKREIPHYYLAHTIDLEPALRWLEKRNAERALDQRVLYGALLVKAVARALVETPSLNGHWRDQRYVPSERVHVGVAISLRGGGLVAPALADAADLDLDTLMAGLRDLTQRARHGRLRGSEVTSATITVSSLGEGTVEAVFPVIYPPQVAIVGFGSVVSRPWVVDGGLHVRRVITTSLAADHRASDGHVGARFLSALERMLMNPEAL